MRVPFQFLTLAAVSVAALWPVVTASQGAASPQRKAGWWEMTMTLSAPMAMTRKMNVCVDDAEAGGSVFQGQQQHMPAECKQGPVTRTPAGWSFSSTCTSGGMTLATSGVANGDFQGNYRVETTTRMSPAPMPQMAETRTVIVGTWKGACPAGRRGGQVW